MTQVINPSGGLSEDQENIINSIAESSQIRVEPGLTTDVAGVAYGNIDDALTYAQANATVSNPLNILVTSNITLTSTITLTNPYVSIRGQGTYNIILSVDDSLAGSSIITINYSTVQTTSPLGNFQLLGSTTLKTTSNTRAINIIGQGIMYLNTLRIQSFNTGIYLDRLSGTTLVTLFEDNVTLRDCFTGVYLDNVSATFSKLISVDCNFNVDVRTNADFTMESGSCSGFLNSKTDIGLIASGTPLIALNSIEFSNLQFGLLLDQATIILNGCNFDDNPGDEVVIHLSVNGNATIRTSSTRFDTSKVQFNTPSFTLDGNFINTKLNDKSFWSVNKLNVGLPNAPREAAFGGGNSYNVTGLFFEFNGTTFTDVKSNILVEGDGSDWSFVNTNTNSALYISNTYILPFLGINVNVTTATVLGAGDLVFEYWNGTAWTEFNHMVTKSSDNYKPFANSKLEQAENVQIRFDERIITDWSVNDPTSSGIDRYWIRIRIASNITTSPTIDLIKLHTSRTELNEDGFSEFFGESRPLRAFPIAYGNFEGATNSPADQDIYLGESLFVGRAENSFQAGTLDKTGVAIALPFDIDTSCPIRLHVIFSGEGATAGDVLFEVRWGWIAPGGNIYRSRTAAPSTSVNEQSIQTIYAYPSGEADVVQRQFFELEVPEVVSQRVLNNASEQGDIIFITIGRLGTDGNDTYVDDINFISVEFYYTAWRIGGHIKAEI